MAPYETAARTNEVLALAIDDIDLANRRAVVIGKSGQAEFIGWETKLARLLPRLLLGPETRAGLPGRHRPRPGRQPALADLDPDTGRARLSYRRTAQLFSEASGGWTLHQLLHSRLTHLAEAGVALPLLCGFGDGLEGGLGVDSEAGQAGMATLGQEALDPHRRRR